MKKALQIISIQHELAMAIGNGLNLSEMLKVFVRVAIARLDLSGAHLFLFCDQQGEPVKVVEPMATAGVTEISHHMSIPVQYQGVAWQDNKILLGLVNDHVRQRNLVTVSQLNGRFFHCFSMPAQGVMVFESVIALDAVVQKALEPIFKKLALSCYACIAHQVLLTEMAARRQAEQTIAHQAAHDELTQLANRRTLTENLEQALNDCRRHHTYGALIFIDLNQFKSINDLMGHDVGDKMLQDVAGRLKAVIRGKDTIARFGGDEFIILLPGISSSEDEAELVVRRTASRIHDTIEMPFTINEAVYNISCSLGFELFSNAADDSVDVIKRADLAMYEAKVLRQRVALRYQPAMAERLNLRAHYISDLKSALKNSEFVLYYQPQFNAANELIGAEALLRWNNPKYIHESPGVYIPIAEESDLILTIGDWVLQEACRHLCMLQRAGLPDSFKKLSINVSAKQLSQVDFFEHVSRAVYLSNANPHQLSIEITENVLISRVHDVMALIAQLKTLGVDCAIDDFGIGYSSLTYLKRLSSSLIKVDRSFVKDIHLDAENRSIVKMIVTLADSLGMGVMAEGVESAEEQACLAALGCHQYQGYYFSKPIPFNELTGLISSLKMEAC